MTDQPDWKANIAKRLTDIADALRAEMEIAINRPLSLRVQLAVALKCILELPQARDVFGNELTDSRSEVKSDLPTDIPDSARIELDYFTLGLDPAQDGIVMICYHESPIGSFVAIIPKARCNESQERDGEDVEHVISIDGVQDGRFAVAGNDPKKIEEIVDQAHDYILGVIAALQINRQAQNDLKETLPRP